MAAQEDSILCPVCQEIYNDPRFLVCGHSFCLYCIKGVAGNKQKFPCPICRFCVDLRDGNVDQLAKNFVLSDVIDAKDMTQPSICVNHKKLLDIFCESCNVMICSKCLLLLHKDHAIEDTDKIFTERNEKLSAFLGITKLWTSTIQEKRYVVEQSRNCMKNNADSINKTVHKAFKKWYDDLQTQKNTILFYLQQEIEKRMQVYDEAESVLKSSMTTVTGLETEISKIRSKGTAFVVQQYDSIVASQEDTRRKILLDIDTCFTPPNDLKMEMFAPWIEEAIGNIQLTDMTQEEVRPRPQTIAEIQSENVVLKRLSHEIRHKVSDGNPNITDLSDHNRPTKLGEIYSELYDNEWTNAFEVLTQTFQLNEKNAIAVLLKILQESSKYASDLSQSNMKKIEKFVIGSSEEPTPECKRLLREARKHVNIEKAEDHIQAYVKNLGKWDEGTYIKKEQVIIYSTKCFQLCWLMSIQDPPVVLSKDPKRGSCFDTNIYNFYTHSGGKFDYVVWPALLLHNGGPLLAKGCAQPCAAPEANSTPTVWRPTTKDDNSFDGTIEEKESASGSDRMNKKQDGYQTRGDGALSLKSGNRQRLSQTYSADGSKYKACSPNPITPKDVQDSELTIKFQKIRDKISKTYSEPV